MNGSTEIRIEVVHTDAHGYEWTCIKRISLAEWKAFQYPGIVAKNEIDSLLVQIEEARK